MKLEQVHFVVAFSVPFLLLWVIDVHVCIDRTWQEKDAMACYSFYITHAPGHTDRPSQESIIDVIQHVIAPRFYFPWCFIDVRTYFCTRGQP